MVAYAYYEETDDRLDGEVEFTPADVEACTDEAQLRDWLESLEVTGDQIRGQLDAARRAGRDDDAWVFRASRALAFVGIGSGRIKRRMKVLGIQLNSQDSKIEALERKVQTLKAEAAFGRNFIHFAQQQLPTHEFDRLHAAAMERLTPQPTQ